jgi:hypothetical protein
MTLLPFAQGMGMIDGGMGYVYAAYGITWVFFLGYAVSLYTRGREEA